MKTYIKTIKRFLETSVIVLAAVSMAGTIAAQDTFQMEIKLSPQLSVEANYASVEKQIHKLCEREAKRYMITGDRAKFRNKYIKACQIEALENATVKIQDPDLLAYFKKMQIERRSLTANLSAK